MDHLIERVSRTLASASSEGKGVLGATVSSVATLGVMGASLLALIAPRLALTTQDCPFNYVSTDITCQAGAPNQRCTMGNGQGCCSSSDPQGDTAFGVCDKRCDCYGNCYYTNCFCSRGLIC